MNVQQFQPLPGTPIYTQLLEEGKITENFLPNAGGYGDVNFIDDRMKDFNFPRFILKVQLRMALSNPTAYISAIRNTGRSFVVSSSYDFFRSLARPNSTVPLPKPGL